MDTYKITRLANDLTAAREKLVQAEKVKAILDFRGHQESVSISVGAIKLQITELDQHYYKSKVKRGYEMIALGITKMLEAELDIAKANVKALEEALIKETNYGNN